MKTVAGNQTQQQSEVYNKPIHLSSEGEYPVNKQTTVSCVHGSYVDFSDFSKSSINFHDIALRLCAIYRYNGGTKTPFSVGSHSLAIQSHLHNRGASTRVQLLALLHDAAEAFMGDMVTPLKGLFPAFAKLEEELFDIICTQLGITEKFTEEEWVQVKLIDEAIRPIEWVVLNDFVLYDEVGVWKQSMFPISDTMRTLALTNQIMTWSKKDVAQTRWAFSLRLDSLLQELTGNPLRETQDGTEEA